MEQIYTEILKPIGIDDTSKIKESRPFDPDFPSLLLIKRETIISSKSDNYMLYDIETGQYIDTLLPWFQHYFDSYQEAMHNKGYECAIYNQKEKIMSYCVCNTKNWSYTIENYKISYQGRVFQCQLIGKYETPNANHCDVLPSSELYILYNVVALESFPIDLRPVDVIILDAKTLTEIRKFEEVGLVEHKSIGNPGEPLYNYDYNKTYINNSVIALESNTDIPDIIFYNYKTDTVLSNVINKAKVSTSEKTSRKSKKNGNWIRYEYKMKYDITHDVKGKPMIRIHNNRGYKYINIMDNYSEDSCSICMEPTQRTKSLVPCGHSQFCLKCIPDLKECPLCRKKVDVIIPRY
jgi:hypothetical protein